MTTRPTGISFLSFLYLLVCLLGLIPIASNSGISGLFQSDNLFYVALYGTIMLSSIGLFMGQKWGWWVIAYATLFSILSKVPILYMSLSNLDLISDVGRFYLKHAGKMLVQLLILIYFFQDPVNHYFKFAKLGNLKRLAILFLLSIGTFAVLYFLK